MTCPKKKHITTVSFFFLSLTLIPQKPPIFHTIKQVVYLDFKDQKKTYKNSTCHVYRYPSDFLYCFFCELCHQTNLHFERRTRGEKVILGFLKGVGMALIRRSLIPFFPGNMNRKIRIGNGERLIWKMMVLHCFFRFFSLNEIIQNENAHF